MKSRWYLATFVMIAGFVLILVLSTVIGNTAVTTLGAEIPAMSAAEAFEGKLIQEGPAPEIPVLLTDEQYKACLLNVQLKAGDPFDEITKPSFVLHFTAEGQAYSAVISADGRISVETEGNPEEGSLFFLDRTRTAFSSLYEEHLISGGQELPKPNSK